MTGPVPRAIAGGVALGLAFNPLTAALGAVVAAAVGTFLILRGGRIWVWIAIGLASWAVGDGSTVAVAAAALARSGGGLLGPAAPSWAQWMLLAVWALVGLVAGYLIPAGIGVAVGRRVRFGTGWLAAGAVSLSVVLTMTILAEAASAAMRPLLGT